MAKDTEEDFGASKLSKYKYQLAERGTLRRPVSSTFRFRAMLY
jgi:hypothetical protein